MAFEFKTGRGTYRLAATSAIESDNVGIILPVSIERTDGVERVAFRFRIARGLVPAGGGVNSESLLARLGPWVERRFEAIREAALKSVRSERRLTEFLFDTENRGPF